MAQAQTAWQSSPILGACPPTRLHTALTKVIPCASSPARLARLHPCSGNAVEPLTYIASGFLVICIVSEQWWMLGYAVIGCAFLGLVLLFGLYLEYGAQVELERQRNAQKRPAAKERNPNWRATAQNKWEE